MDINNMLDMVTNLETLFIDKCVSYTKTENFKENLIAFASEITLIEEMDQRFTTEEYKPKLDLLIVETIKQTKQHIDPIKPETLSKVTRYLNNYVGYYYTQVENAMPIKMVGDVDGNEMFVFAFIDEYFDFFNES